MFRLSIITINFNNGEGLHKTIRSVVKQSFKYYEFIIIDGGSTDTSVEIIKQYSDKINYWISEKDNGIYHAQNKGIALASGEYLLFLNSGDCLVNNHILTQISASLDGYNEIVYGDLNIVEPHKTWVKAYSEKITFGYFMRDTLPHQASFIKKDLISKVGEFDESYLLASDWKFFINAVCKYHAKLHYLAIVISDYDFTGISSLSENYQSLVREKQAMLEADFPLFHFDYKKLVEENKNLKAYLNSRIVKLLFRFRNKFLK